MEPKVLELIAKYAEVYQGFEKPQKGNNSILTGGDQKTGVIAEYYAKCYIESVFNVNANYASPGSSWDIDFLVDGKINQVQVKGVSAHSKTRTIAPLSLKNQSGSNSFDQLYLIDLDLDFKPVGLYINSYEQILRKVAGDRTRLQGTKMIDTLKNKGGSRYYDFTNNRVQQLVDALETEGGEYGE